MAAEAGGPADDDDVSNSNGSSDEEDDDGELMVEINQTRKKLEDNLYNYEDHVKLIALLRKAGDLHGARTARGNMADVFPLSEDIWLEWIKDEMTLVTIPSAAKDLSELFERAVQDYLSVAIWLEYMQFAIEAMSEGFDYPREIFEKAIINVGLHTSQGIMVWNVYKDFEKAILNSLQNIQSDDPENVDVKEQVQAQYDMVDRLYRRQLSVPLIGMDGVFEEYKMFNSELSVSEDTAPYYTRAMKRLQILLPYEEKLTTSNTLETYNEYIDKLVQIKEDSVLIDALYQRAIADYPLEMSLWNKYHKFLNGNFYNVKPLILKGYKQSIRNCPWMVSYWVGYAQHQERLNEPHNDIISTYEEALGDNFTEGGHYLQIWTSYCNYLHRIAIRESSGEEEKTDLRKLFRRAREHLDASYDREGDPMDSLSRYQASIEARCYGNMDEVRLLWTDVMSRHGNQARYWLEYIELERSFGDLGKCRKLYHMSVNSVSDDPERVCDRLIQFEREQGTLETLQNAMVKCSSQLERIEERKKKAVEKLEEKKKQGKKKSNKGNERGPVESQRGPAGPQSKAGKKRKAEPPGVVFYTESNEEEIKDRNQKKIKTEDQSGDSSIGPPPGFSASYDNSIALPPADTNMEVDTPAVSSDNKIKEIKREDCTIFVSNLPYNATQDQLKGIFSQCGDISDIRLIKSRSSGRPNVYAYIEYTSTGPVEQGLLLDRTQLNNRPIYVSQCNSSTSSGPKQSKYNDKATVYVTGIAHDLNEKQLEEVFQEAGPIKEVRLVRNRDGRSKGFAYIEYVDEHSAKASVMKVDGREMFGKNLKVALSRPRPANTSRGGGTQRDRQFPLHQDVPLTRKTESSQSPRTNISLVPRALARKKDPSTNDAPTTTTTTNTATEDLVIQKKSNDDFRKLIYKQE